MLRYEKGYYVLDQPQVHVPNEAVSGSSSHTYLGRHCKFKSLMPKHLRSTHLDGLGSIIRALG
jgi:hypothetical protein